MSETRRGRFPLMLSVKGATVVCKEETAERKIIVYLQVLFLKKKKSLVLTVEGEGLLLGGSQTLKLSLVASARTRFYTFGCCMCGFA